jgi:malonyl-CoA O-methyltransferase
MTSLAAVPDFDRRASQYEQHAQVQRRAARWLAEWVPARVEGPALELGAGTGLFTQYIASASDQLLATDISTRMVETGSRKLSKPRWLVSDANKPPADCAYRWIFSCSLAQWLTNPEAALARWRSVAAPGAHLVAGWFILGTMQELLERCPETSVMHWRSAEEWLDILQRSGWTTQRHDTCHFPMQHPDTTSLLRDLHNLGAVVPRRLTTTQLRRVIRVHDQHHRVDGVVTTPFVFMRVEATNQ